jgi:hypothetical protein
MAGKKLRKWLIGILGSLILLVVIGYVSWNYAVGYVIGSIAANGLSGSSGSVVEVGESGKDSVKEPVTPTQSVSGSGAIVGATGGQAQGQNDKPIQDGKVDQSGKTDPGTLNTNPDQGVSKDQPVASDTKGGNAVTAPGSTKAQAPTGQPPAAAPSSSAPTTPPPDAAPSEPVYDGNISPDKAKQAEDSITISEKAKLTAILLKKLSPSDISLFMKMAGDGMTTDEKLEAKKVFLQKLTEAEYNDLIAIAAKYGLSSGRDYKETAKDYDKPVTKPQ